MGILKYHAILLAYLVIVKKVNPLLMNKQVNLIIQKKKTINNSFALFKHFNNFKEIFMILVNIHRPKLKINMDITC